VARGIVIDVTGVEATKFGAVAGGPGRDTAGRVACVGEAPAGGVDIHNGRSASAGTDAVGVEVMPFVDVHESAWFMLAIVLTDEPW